MRGNLHYPHFTAEKTEPQEGHMNNLPTVPGLGEANLNPYCLTPQLTLPLYS